MSLPQQPSPPRSEAGVFFNLKLKLKPYFPFLFVWPFAPPTRRLPVEITLWRLTNSLVIFAFGVTKATFSYLGYVTTPTTLDWILGVGWALISYWLSLLENGNPQVAEWFFHDDLYFTGRLNIPVAVILTVMMYWAFMQILLEVVSAVVGKIPDSPFVVVMVFVIIFGCCFVTIIFLLFLGVLGRFLVWLSHANLSPYGGSNMFKYLDYHCDWSHTKVAVVRGVGLCLAIAAYLYAFASGFYAAFNSIVYEMPPLALRLLFPFVLFLMAGLLIIVALLGQLLAFSITGLYGLLRKLIKRDKHD